MKHLTSYFPQSQLGTHAPIRRGNVRRVIDNDKSPVATPSEQQLLLLCFIYYIAMWDNDPHFLRNCTTLCIVYVKALPFIVPHKPHAVFGNVHNLMH